MSADNAYFVIHSMVDGVHVYSVLHGSMSCFVENGTEYDPHMLNLKGMYKSGRKFSDENAREARAAALLFAHDCARDEIVEYGVIEVELDKPDDVIHEWASEKEMEQDEIRRHIARVSEILDRHGIRRLDEGERGSP